MEEYARRNSGYHRDSRTAASELGESAHQCFLLALIMSVALELLELNSNLRLGIATGLLGAFTTFSTICKEASSLIFQGLYFQAPRTKVRNNNEPDFCWGWRRFREYHEILFRKSHYSKIKTHIVSYRYLYH
ncbi:MAG: fluoride efflux transporter FluC [Burkholderiales bacterium]